TSTSPIACTLPLKFYFFCFQCSGSHRALHSFPTRRSSDLPLHSSPRAPPSAPSPSRCSPRSRRSPGAPLPCTRASTSWGRLRRACCCPRRSSSSRCSTCSSCPRSPRCSPTPSSPGSGDVRDHRRHGDDNCSRRLCYSCVFHSARCHRPVISGRQADDVTLRTSKGPPCLLRSVPALPRPPVAPSWVSPV